MAAVTWEEALETPDGTISYTPGDFSVIGDGSYAGWISPSQPFRPLDLLRTRNYEPPLALAPPPIFPTVVVQPSVEPTRVFVPETAGAEVLEVPEDPEDDPFENPVPGPVFEPQNEWYRRTPPTDWGRVYDQYVVLNEPEDEPVAVEWGTLAGNVIGSWAAQQFAPSLAQSVPNVGGIGNTVNMPAAPAAAVATMAANCSTCPGGSPRYAKICLATNEITPLRRRRRRRLLTAGDLNDIAALKAIVGGGAALNAAVVKAMK